MVKNFVLFLFLAASQLLAHPEKNPVVLMVGTRPEAIKMLPVYKALKNEGVATVLCSTGQHRELLDNVLDFYRIVPDRDFKIMRPNQNLFYLTEVILQNCKDFFGEIEPSLVVVQGDTTTAMASALAAFYMKIPVAHVEAGLRSGDITRPFPEEMNRRMISLISTLNFAPTLHAEEKLLTEGISQSSIFNTGNTVVDSLYEVIDRIESDDLQLNSDVVILVESLKKQGKKLILLTAHRRESFQNRGIHQIFSAVKQALIESPDLFVIYPMHPNPRIKEILDEVELGELSNIWVTKPLSYPDLVYVMNAADAIATDSGGIQEEGVSLNKLTFVLRNETGRPEGDKNGSSILVGTNKEVILSHLRSIKHQESKRGTSIYGDGKAGIKIAQIIKRFLDEKAAH